MSIYQPYTYHIAWSKTNKHYYGVRYAKNCNPNDFWISYFTSSKIVQQYRKEHGEPDVIEIRKTFDSAEKARLWESKVLQKLNVLKSEKWLNANISGEKFHFSSHLRDDYSPWNKGKTNVYSNETRKKMSETRKQKNIEPWNKGIKCSPEFCEKISEIIKEKWNDPEYRKKQESKIHYNDLDYKKRISESQLKIKDQISQRQTGTKNSFYGKKHTEESNQNRREKLKDYYWWTDGQTNVRSKICPPGFRRGKCNINKDSKGRFMS